MNCFFLHEHEDWVKSSCLYFKMPVWGLPSHAHGPIFMSSLLPHTIQWTRGGTEVIITRFFVMFIEPRPNGRDHSLPLSKTWMLDCSRIDVDRSFMFLMKFSGGWCWGLVEELRIVLLMPLVVIVLRDSKGRSPEKTDLIGILSKLEGGRALPIFLAPFCRCIFGQ